MNIVKWTLTTDDLFMAKSACCGAPLERRNDGKLYCSECGSFQGT